MDRVHDSVSVDIAITAEALDERSLVSVISVDGSPRTSRGSYSSGLKYMCYGWRDTGVKVAAKNGIEEVNITMEDVVINLQVSVQATPRISKWSIEFAVWAHSFDGKGKYYFVGTRRGMRGDVPYDGWVVRVQAA